MTGLALAFLAGIGLSHAGWIPPVGPLTLLALAGLIAPWIRPRAPSALLAAGAAGLLGGQAATAGPGAGCTGGLRDGQRVAVRGWLPTTPPPGGGVLPLRLTGSAGRPCAGEVRIVPRPGVLLPGSGAALDVRGRWRATRGRGGGVLLVEAWEVVEPTAGIARMAAVVRGRIQERMRELWPRRSALVEALVLARKEGLNPDLRDAFAVAGTAHLLAISGFHVGVVSTLLLLALRRAGLARRPAGVGGAVGVWLYVAGIGAPDAAVRAAVLLTAVAVARLRARPPSGPGLLATAGLLALAVDPGAALRIGFQLSFAGAAGLALAARPLEAALLRTSRGRLPRGLASAVAAGAAATLATLPLVAWHFERVSLVGIPATLVAGPLVALAIPGVFGALALSLVGEAPAAFLAGGVDLVLAVLVGVVRGMAELPFASAWVPRSWVPAAAAGAGVALLGLHRVRGLRPPVRRAVLVAAATASVLFRPAVDAWLSRGTVEVVVLDVGQGDAIAIRSPAGRWVLVDAGPRGERWDAGARTVVPFFRRRGVGVLELLVLTHPDLDHIGGGPAVLEALDVRAVLDPAVAEGKRPYVAVLETARERGVGWWEARAGRVFHLDDIELEVLYPSPEGVREGESNDRSVVLALRYGDFRALLTGDAPSEVEERILARLDPGSLQVLKVGHHGSATSTSVGLLRSTLPELALISVGRGNRYGHPEAGVIRRLEGVGARVLRTDRSGTIRIRARPDGSYTVEAERLPGLPGRAGSPPEPPSRR